MNIIGEKGATIDKRKINRRYHAKKTIIQTSKPAQLITLKGSRFYNIKIQRMMTMMQMEMGSSSLDQEHKTGINGYDEEDSFSSDVSSVVSSDDESDDDFEQSNSFSLNNDHALGNMSDLIHQLPPKKGLSKHFQGKSQSFTSLSKVTCLEDLAKPENPYNKKLKSCKGYVALSGVLPPPTRSASSSKLFTKLASSSRASCSSLSNSSGPPTHPSHGNGATSGGGFSNQTPLFV
ncbi:hypothetical protein L1987_71299 [Smallanthus sonchifolius]|uniref:Uncharacterized protein n=1 Tax=Smallanthus sonchifolius TaxID=185202 RepID=A0ACB9ASV6_9ASTR|nr:hypothetical protein L1987_71299 [Smallanthus sonchifolius]